MLNYGITQNQDVPLNETQSDLSMYELCRYEEMGDSAHRLGQESEAIDWYTKGLVIAKELNVKEKIVLFSNLIITSL